MARVLTPATYIEEVAIVRHRCGATVEFTRSDVALRPFSSEVVDYVYCPACKASPRIGVANLKWKGGIHPCAKWNGADGNCATCGVAAYLHPNPPTPQSRGCTKFVCEGPTGIGLGDATRCEFCCLPQRDHK